MHGIVINVPTNVDQIQSIFPHLPRDNATICVFQLISYFKSSHTL